MKPRLLDLFCGAGGAAMGYHRAGFEVVGVDIHPQKNYPFEFHQADAMTFPLDGFDAIHASPPCQAYSPHVSSKSSWWAGTKGKDEPALIDSTRDRLFATGKPYVMENVMGARDALNGSLLLCGTMFGLPIARHRLFEMPFLIISPAHARCSGVAKEYALQRGWNPRDMTVSGKGRNAGTKERWKEVMGWPEDVDVTQHGLREAIPPAYTFFIGRHLMQVIQSEVRL